MLKKQQYTQKQETVFAILEKNRNNRDEIEREKENESDENRKNSKSYIMY